MARRSLKPQLNQIRAWVRQGRTDAWIAHQLEVSAAELREFRKQHDLMPDGEEAGADEVDLRDEIEAEVEAATVEEAEEEPEEAEEEPEEAEEPEEEPAGEEEDEAEDEEETKAGAEKPKPARARKPARKESKAGGDGDGERPRRRRRRGRRGGRGRRREYEATFDHGERDGYGLWLDPSVKDNQVYAEHWAGKREVTVRIDADQIIIRRAGESGGESDRSD